MPAIAVLFLIMGAITLSGEVQRSSDTTAVSDEVRAEKISEENLSEKKTSEDSVSQNMSRHVSPAFMMGRAQGRRGRRPSRSAVSPPPRRDESARQGQPKENRRPSPGKTQPSQ
ncbi:MAG: hypothetical protein ACQEQ4_02685 [Fibrobacterota bacterium]